ncbi:hypothetical protein PIGBHMHK_00191 [Mycoplasmopsis arginini]|uniref:hypothetical protein n=1 Tax=Mycoplasmopsis arginini TaxID=2094 RepID=UPI00249E16A6|nr:hypothetical protein [Mycoplasmopsis arginini]MDI3348801.1 hypothetical protein [Mycoplasmopsis arginini]
MSKSKKILLSLTLIAPTMVIPMLSISCNDKVNQEDTTKAKTLLENEIKLIEELFNANKTSLAFTKVQAKTYEVAISNAKKILANPTKSIEIEAITVLVTKAKEEMKANITALYSKTDQELLILAEEYLTFSYPNISETKLADADVEKIAYTLPKEFEFSKYKAVKNEETSDITIIYKLQKIGSDFGHTKNQSFTLKGWAKSEADIQKENQEKEQLNQNLASLKVRFLNEKAYQHVNSNLTINNFEDKSNFVVDEYNKDLYNFELSNLVKESENTFKIDVLLTSKTNEEISKKATILIDKERYSKENSINPHNLTEQEQIAYLNAQFEELSIYPFYSKDKTFLQREDYAKLTDKSYWLTKKNNQLHYLFKEVRSEEETRKVIVEVSFDNWLESPKTSKEIIIDLSKLGVDELNKIRKEKGQDPVEDYEAPSATIDEVKYSKVELVDFQDTTEDEYLTEVAGYRYIHDKALKNLKSKPLLLLNKEVEDLIKSEGENFVRAQHFVFNRETLKRDSELFFYNYTKTFVDIQNVLIFSKPVFEGEKLKSIKITFGSLSDIINRDYSKLSSTRLKIDTTKYGEADLKKLELTEEIKVKGFDRKLTYNGKYTKADFKLENLVYTTKVPEGYTMIKPTEFTVNKNETKISVVVRYQKDGIESYAFVTEFPVK